MARSRQDGYLLVSHRSEDYVIVEQTDRQHRVIIFSFQ